MAIMSVLHGGAAGQLDYVKGTNRPARPDDNDDDDDDEDDDEDVPQTGNGGLAMARSTELCFMTILLSGLL